MRHPIALALALVLCSCASGPITPPYVIKCLNVEPQGVYGVQHRMDSRRGTYMSDRWRCVGPMEEILVRQ